MLAASSFAFAQTDTVPGTATPIVTTRHRIEVGGRTVAYTARAGLLPIRKYFCGEQTKYQADQFCVVGLGLMRVSVGVPRRTDRLPNEQVQFGLNDRLDRRHKPRVIEVELNWRCIE